MSLNNNGPKAQQIPVSAQQAASQGRLGISAVPPTPIKLPAPHDGICSDKNALSVCINLKVGFDSRNPNCLPPRIGALRMKLGSSTSLKASPSRPESYTSFDFGISCVGEEHRKI